MNNGSEEGQLDQSIDKAEELTGLEFSSTQRALSTEEQQRLQQLRLQQTELKQAATVDAKETYQYETRFDKKQTDEQN